MNAVEYEAAMIIKVLIKMLVLNTLLVAFAFGRGLPEDVDSDDAQRAKNLLTKAVHYYQEKGDAALAALSRQGRFIDDELYVYVVDTSGIMLASGGPSANLIGRDVTQSLSDDLQAEFREALEQPETGEIRHSTYRWQNWSSGRTERKSVYYRRLDDKIFAVGYYITRASEEEAETLLDHVVQAVRTNPAQTIDRINHLDSGFHSGDLYAFIVDRDTERFVAHGYNLRLIGSDFNTIRSTDKKPVGQQILDLAKSNKSGRVSYLWPNPVTKSNEQKVALFRVTDNYIVVVGFYLESHQ